MIRLREAIYGYQQDRNQEQQDRNQERQDREQQDRNREDRNREDRNQHTRMRNQKYIEKSNRVFSFGFRPICTPTDETGNQH